MVNYTIDTIINKTQKINLVSYLRTPFWRSYFCIHHQHQELPPKISNH
ncbi:hypothetical protein CIT292_09233 [Citrobacter youngae ATCC 29220]|uniref:Uncharacterized protein n=1 Tax=Citrobacter youngae ATCC 29220 TaxID=500640 RepID=D4BG62_9ENTR|nr:hypothetical protein CIT292_09233 [Citrobacter youngae ATCC 29220]